MRVKTVRASGKPVDLKKIAEFEQEYKDGMDAIYDEHPPSAKNMHIVQEEVSRLDKRMVEKYDTIVDFELPKTGKAWKQLVETYGSMLVSTHKDTGEVMLVVMDMGI